MSKIQDEAIKLGISKDMLVELLIEETLWPFESLEDCIKQLHKNGEL